MRKITFLLLLFFILSTPLISQGTTAMPSLDNVFNSSEFKLKEVNVSGWVKLDKPCSDMGSLRQYGYKIYNDISGRLDAGDASEIQGNSQISILGEHKGLSISVTVKTIHNALLDKYDTLIIADVTQHQYMMNITDIREGIINSLNKYGSSPNVNVCATKYIEGYVDVNRRKDLLHKAFASINAEEVEDMEDENIISICGYSKHLPYSIKSGDRFININLACRYSSFDNKTYFWLGTPVINAEY